MKSGVQPTMVQRLSFFAFASLLTIFCGSFAIWHTGGGATMALGNPVGWGIGLVVSVAILQAPKIPNVSEAILATTLIALAATFADSGTSGVHRWMSLGLLQVNIAALLLPPFVAILSLGKTNQPLAALVLLAAMSLLVAQPDASQATALAITSPLLFGRWQSKWRWPMLGATLALAVTSWYRSDPLSPVAQVEGIFGIMWQMSPLLAAAGLAALAATIAAIRQANASTVALTAYCATIAVMPILGHFPVPLAGAGLSFPLGWWLGIAVLLRSRRFDQSRI